jgi:hypothetical protein
MSEIRPEGGSDYAFPLCPISLDPLEPGTPSVELRGMRFSASALSHWLRTERAAFPARPPRHPVLLHSPPLTAAEIAAVAAAATGPRGAEGGEKQGGEEGWVEEEEDDAPRSCCAVLLSACCSFWGGHDVFVNDGTLVRCAWILVLLLCSALGLVLLAAG